MVGVLLLAAVGSYWGDELWRALHPPVRLAPATLPQPFDWGEVARRMAAYRDAEGEGDSPEESDSVYLMIRDTVTLEYADVARRILSQYDGSVRWYAIEPELGADRSGRACFVSCRDVWRFDPPVALPSPYRGLILVDRMDAVARLRDEGPWRWTEMHAREIDGVTGEVAEHRREMATVPGVSDLFGPRQVIGA